MLVVEDRHEAVRRAHRGDDLVEEPLPRVLDLAEFVDGVIAVLADEQHRVDRQPFPAERQRLADAAKDRDAEPRRPPPAEVVLRKLVDVKRHYLHRRSHRPGVQVVPGNQLGNEYVGVRVLPPHRRDRSISVWVHN